MYLCYEISAWIYDVILFTETWLNSSICESEICDLTKYSVYRRVRDNPDVKQGGGVLVWVSKKYYSQVHCEWSSLAKDIWVSITSSIFHKLYLCYVTYIKPTISTKLVTLFPISPTTTKMV